MSNRITRATIRTALVLLAMGLIVAAAIALTPPFDNKTVEAQIVARAQQRPPTPGSEEALRRIIGETQRGQPDYARMSPQLADAVRQQLPRNRQVMVDLGALQSLAYLGGQRDADLYRANFAKGSLLWGIIMRNDGIIDGAFFRSPQSPTPQDWIENYARFPWGERGKRMAEQLAILLVAAAFGRYALRLRL